MTAAYERLGELLGEQSYDEPADGWPDSPADLGETDCSPFCMPPRWLGAERQDGEHDYECPRLAQLRAEGEVPV